MAQPIYKVWFVKYKEPYYKLSPEEQKKFSEKNEESLKQVGGEKIVACVGVWANEEWLGWGVEKYPDLEALQKHTMNLYAMNWFEYVESKTYLGTEMPQM